MKKTLTVEVDEELHQKVGVHARMNKITITKYITDLITKDLSATSFDFLSAPRNLAKFSSKQKTQVNLKFRFSRFSNFYLSDHR